MFLWLIADNIYIYIYNIFLNQSNLFDLNKSKINYTNKYIYFNINIFYRNIQIRDLLFFLGWGGGGGGGGGVGGGGGGGVFESTKPVHVEIISISLLVLYMRVVVCTCVVVLLRVVDERDLCSHLLEEDFVLFVPRTACSHLVIQLW